MTLEGNNPSLSLETEGSWTVPSGRRARPDEATLFRDLDDIWWWLHIDIAFVYGSRWSREIETKVWENLRCWRHVPLQCKQTSNADRPDPYGTNSWSHAAWIWKNAVLFRLIHLTVCDWPWATRNLKTHSGSQSYSNRWTQGSFELQVQVRCYGNWIMLDWESDKTKWREL